MKAMLVRALGALSLVLFGGTCSLAVGPARHDLPGVVNTADVILAVNLTRNGKINVGQRSLSSAPGLNTKISEKFKDIVDSKANCALMTRTNTPREVKGLLLQHATKNVIGENDIRRIMQAEITKGLASLKTNPKRFGDITESSAQNLAYVMNANATMLVCAVTHKCDGPRAFVFCQFDKTPQDDDKPFSDALFKALLEREQSGIKIYDLNEDDLLTMLNAGAAPQALELIGFSAIVFFSALSQV